MKKLTDISPAWHYTCSSLVKIYQLYFFETRYMYYIENNTWQNLYYTLYQPETLIYQPEERILRADVRLELIRV